LTHPLPGRPRPSSPTLLGHPTHAATLATSRYSQGIFFII
jgi:hypothetical protein